MHNLNKIMYLSLNAVENIWDNVSEKFNKKFNKYVVTCFETL